MVKLIGRLFLSTVTAVAATARVRVLPIVIVRASTTSTVIAVAATVRVPPSDKEIPDNSGSGNSQVTFYNHNNLGIDLLEKKKKKKKKKKTLVKQYILFEFYYLSYKYK